LKSAEARLRVRVPSIEDYAAYQHIDSHGEVCQNGLMTKTHFDEFRCHRRKVSMRRTAVFVAE